MLRASFIVVVLALAQAENAKVPHLDDETPLSTVKANPEKFVGKTFTICGGVQIDDYYKAAYQDAKRTHYSLDFREAGETLADLKGEYCNLYLSRNKIAETIIEAIDKTDDAKNVVRQGRSNRKTEPITETDEATRSRNVFKLVRVQVTLDPARYARDKKWDDMEVVDVQLLEDDQKGWRPWVFESYKNADLARREAIQKEKQRKIESDRQAAAEKKKDVDADKWRTWTDSKGQTFKAKYAGVAAGLVKLVKEDGATVTVPLNKLSDKDRDWIKKKK